MCRFFYWLDLPETKITLRVAVFFVFGNPTYIYLGNIVNFYYFKRNHEDGENREPIIPYTKRAKLASLTGFDVQVKLSQYVSKDTNFSLKLINSLR